jgi:hypothetical protein
MTATEIYATLRHMTHRDPAGRHFTERYSAVILRQLESAGLITIHRPIHHPTGVAYSQDHWTFTVTPAGTHWLETYTTDAPVPTLADQGTDMNATLDKLVAQKACEDAALFVEEFAAPLDPAATDWDAEAWTVSRRELNLTPEQADALWPVYQSALVAETQRLAQ